MSDKDSIFFRYLSDRGGLTNPMNTNPGTLPLWPTFDNSKNQFATLQDRHIFSANLVNVFSTAFSQPTSGEIQPSTTPQLQVFPWAEPPGHFHFRTGPCVFPWSRHRFQFSIHAKQIHAKRRCDLDQGQPHP